MDLKEFKGGMTFIAKSTNQRQSDPEPFGVQVGADSTLSFFSGSMKEVFIWRTEQSVDAPRQRFGIPSKMMMQSIKALKGSKLSLSFSVTNDGLIVSTSSGGRILFPMVDEPVVLRPWSDTNSPVMSLRKETLKRWSDAFSIAFTPTEDSVQFDTDGRVSASDGIIMFATRGTLSTSLPERRWVRASFWNALRGATSDATLTFSESGLRVRAGQFEALASFLERQRIYPDMKQQYFPDGQTPHMWMVVDKKTFVNNIRAVATTSKGEQVFMSLPLKEEGLVLKGIQTNANVVMGVERRTKNWGTISAGAKYLTDILSAIDSNKVIVSWTENARHPIGIRDVSQQHEWFLLAPVSYQ